MKAEEIVPPRPPAATSTSSQEVEREEPSEDGRRRHVAPSRTPPRAKTTLERLRDLEAALDRALDRSYERFRRGEITATDMHRERDQLVGASNRVVMAENIRYRSMLRGPAHRAG